MSPNEVYKKGLIPEESETKGSIVNSGLLNDTEHK